MLYAVPELDTDDRRVLSEIDGFYASFATATGGSRAVRWNGGIRKRLRAGMIRGSNSIEGYTVDIETALALERGSTVPAEVDPDTRAAVAGYRDAMDWVLRTPEMGFFRHGEMVLSALHFLMVRHWPEKSPGVYRPGGIVVAGADPLTPEYVGPSASEVPLLMGEFTEWLESGDLDAHVLVRAAMAHLDLVSIHPWRDGNGRMSRSVQTLVIARDGRTHPEFCSIEEWLGHEANTLDYYRVLRGRGTEFQPAADVHEWVRFCLRAHHLQAQVVQRRLDLGRSLWAAIETFAAERTLNPRVASALYASATDRLQRDTYQTEEGLSRDQAIRDVRALERAGVLEAVGYGSTLHYRPAGEFADLVAAETARVTAPAREPY